MNQEYITTSYQFGGKQLRTIQAANKSENNVVMVPSPPSGWEYGDSAWFLAYSMYNKTDWFQERYLNKKGEQMMSMDLTVFDFKKNSIRYKVIDGEAWFVGQDVCKPLGIKNNRNAVNRLHNTDVRLMDTDTPTGIRKMAYVNESGLYQLVLRSDSPDAKEFQHHITSVILPSIRKTGSYSVKPPQPISSQLEFMQQCLDVLKEQDKKNREQDAEIANIKTELAEVKQAQQQPYQAIEYHTITETNQMTMKLLAPVINSISPRRGISAWIREYAHLLKKETDEDYKFFYDNLYREFKYRYGIDLVNRAKNQGKKPLDVAEAINMVEDLLWVCMTIYPIKKTADGATTGK